MKRRPIASPLEYWNIARRRWLWIVIPALAITGLTALVAPRLPKLYRSEALILVDPQKVPADFVKPTVSGNVALRLESIEEQILSRTGLDQIIQKYGLYQGHGYTQDQQVTHMLADIQVTPVADTNQRDSQVTAFRISYQGPDPVVAQQVTRDLTAHFLSENLQARAQQAQGTETFLQGQVADAAQKLQGLDAQLRQVQSANMGSLPEQQDANLQVLGQLQTVLQTNADGLARAEQQKTYLTSLSQAVAAGASAPTDAPPSQTEVDLRKAKSDLAIAEQNYTPQHPDVIRLKAEVRALTAREAESRGATAGTAPAGTAATSAPADGLSAAQRGQIAVLDQEIKQRTLAQRQTEAKIARMQGNLERLPEVQAQLSSLQTSYNEAKLNYTTLLQKAQAASMGAAMEQQAEGEEFRIMDPASLPQKPISPDVPRIDLLGLAAGLLAGIGLCWLAENRDPVVRDEADLSFYGQVPIFAVLPVLPSLAARTAPALPTSRT